MQLCDLTLASPAANLACDEVLLDWAEETGAEVLRFWGNGEQSDNRSAHGAAQGACGQVPRQPETERALLRAPSEGAPRFVVLGYANRVAAEVDQIACAEEGVGIYRRCTGGGAVLQGPGCLNYSLVLQIRETGPLRSISGANRWIMERHRTAVAALMGGASVCREDGSREPSPPPPLPPDGSEASSRRERKGDGLTMASQVEICGHTDLTLAERKFSGNAQRRLRHALLFHGTFLFAFELPLIKRFLHPPSRQPEYRQNRDHEDFLVNLPLPPAVVKEGLRRLWRAEAPLTDWPQERVRRLAAEKYENAGWNLKL